MSDSYEWVKQQLCQDNNLTASKLSERAFSQGYKIYPSLISTVRRELGIPAVRGRPKKIALGMPEVVKAAKPTKKNTLGMTTAAKGIEAKMAKRIPARANASFDDAIAVMQIAKQLGGYGVLYDIVDKLKKAGFE